MKATRSAPWRSSRRRVPNAKEGEERPAREAVLHAIEEAHQDVQGEDQEDIGDESHTKGLLSGAAPTLHKRPRRGT